MSRLGLLVVCLFLQTAAAAGPPPPVDLDQRAGFDQRLGATVPMTTRFRDAGGQPMTLEQLAQGKPLLIALGYYRCPNLCDAVWQGIAHAASAVPEHVGTDYQIAFISIDPGESPVDARRAQAMLLRMDPSAKVERWHLLTGNQDAIHAVADAIGYRYFFDARNDQFAHPAGIVIVTTKGRIASYFFGVAFPGAALTTALNDAARERTGGFIDQLVLLCCGYDPTTGRHSAAIARAMQALGIAFVGLMAIAWWRIASNRSRA